MYTTFRIKKEELNEKFIRTIKALFKDEEIEISVSSTDETKYLLASEANKKRLLSAIKNIRQKKNLLPFDFRRFK